MHCNESEKKCLDPSLYPDSQQTDTDENITFFPLLLNKSSDFSLEVTRLNGKLPRIKLQIPVWTLLEKCWDNASTQLNLIYNKGVSFFFRHFNVEILYIIFLSWSHKLIDKICCIPQTSGKLEYNRKGSFLRQWIFREPCDILQLNIMLELHICCQIEVVLFFHCHKPFCFFNHKSLCFHFYKMSFMVPAQHTHQD